MVRHPGACAVVALTPDGEVLLVRQFRQAVRQPLLEIPAGILDVQGEDGPACAARELMEETGYRVARIEPLATIHTSPGFADERIEIFLAETGREPSAPPGEDGIDTIRLPLAEAVAAAKDGRITDAKSIAGLLLAAGRRLAPAPT